MPAINKVGFDAAVGPALQAGVDYNLTGHWFLYADAKRMFLNTGARINGGIIRARTSFDPTVIGLGIDYRF